MARRQWFVVRGDRTSTRAQAEAVVRSAPDVLWIGSDPGETRPGEVRRKLGAAYDAVVVSTHDGLDLDVLGQAHGFVWGGGALVVRAPREPPATPALAVWPHGPDAVGRRAWDRLERHLRDADPPAPVGPTDRPTGGTADQARAVDALVEAWSAPHPSATVLTADRGRGKSAALGLALARLDGLRIAVTAGTPDAAAEVARFAPTAPFVDPAALASCPGAYDVIAIDEAASLPVALLQRIVRAHPDARLGFATTTRGYEGTGRGFVLRFLTWLERHRPPVRRLTLDQPIRWDADDPLEARVFDLLLLDAAPAAPVAGAHTVAPIDRDALDEPRLRALFGLLVHAHYRTTPSDLHRALDAPNLDWFAADRGGVPIGAALLAREGGLPRAACEALARGGDRIRGHVLPDTLISHAGAVDAGELTYVRSVRIASHPDERRAGIGRALVEAVHAAYTPDAFGTVFGATPELLAFRRALGYQLVRVGIARGARTGEPAAVMLRPRSDRAHLLVERLTAELARDLPTQLEWLVVDGGLAVDPELLAAFTVDLPAPAPLDDAAARVAAYASGPRPFETVATALDQLLRERRDQLHPADRSLVLGRLEGRRSWVELARDHHQTVPAVMRSMRRAVARWIGLDPPAA